MLVWSKVRIEASLHGVKAVYTSNRVTDGYSSVVTERVVTVTIVFLCHRCHMYLCQSSTAVTLRQ